MDKVTQEQFAKLVAVADLLDEQKRQREGVAPTKKFANMLRRFCREQLGIDLTEEQARAMADYELYKLKPE